nr:hypothetical protein [Thermus scotoductus]
MDHLLIRPGIPIIPTGLDIAFCVTNGNQGSLYPLPEDVHVSVVEAVAIAGLNLDFIDPFTGDLFHLFLCHQIAPLAVLGSMAPVRRC